VQAVVRSRLDPATRLKRLTSAAELLIGTDPGDPDDPASWRAWSATAPHALVLGRLASESESPPPLMALLRSTASYLRQRGLFRSACDALSTAVDVAIHGHVDARTLGEMRSELGDLHDLAGDVHAARDEHARALELLEQEHSPEDERIVLARARLGHLLNCAGDSRAAITLLQDAVPTLRTSSGARHLIKACVDLGYACWAAGELAKAEASFQEALDELARAQVALPELYAEAMSGLGMVRQDQGDLVLAAQLIEGALAVLGEVFGEDDHPTLAQAHDKHGFVLRLHGKVAAAIDAHIEAHRMLSTTVGESDPRTAMALSNLGLAYRDAGRIAESVGAQQQAHELLLHSYGPEHRNTRFVAERLNELGISAIR